MADAPYRLGFVSGSLLAHHSKIAAGIFLETGDWETTKQRVRDGNLFQTRTPSTTSRYLLEVVRRLKALDDPLLTIVAGEDPTQRAQVLWVAACRYYQLLGDFASEVVRDKFLHGNQKLQPEDFTRFVNQQSLWHPQLEEKTERTIKNLRNNAFKMLKETSLLEPDGRISQALLSPEVRKALAPSDLWFFPASDPLEDARTTEGSMTTEGTP